MKNRRSVAVLSCLVAIAIFGCTAVRQQKALPPVNDNAGFHNLQVLRSTLTHDELIGVMRGITRALNVRCDHCHVLIPGGGERDFDFPSDAKPEKKVARMMLRMVGTINGDYVSKVNAHGQTVTCGTCHRGHTVPEAFNPPPPQEAPAPQPAPLP